MSEQQRGATASGPFAVFPDGRIPEIDSALRSVETISASIAPGLGLQRDPNRVAGLHARRMPGHNEVLPGLVVHSIAGAGWYKVQLGQEGWIPACCLSSGGLLPFGVKDIGAIPPNASVLVRKPHNLNYGIILGVIPPIQRDGRLVNPDWVVQGGQSGYKREQAHSYPVKNTYREGGVMDFSGQRPIDGSTQERGWISSTGLAVSIDEWMLQMRVNEACGLFLSIFDSHCRLAGVQMDIVSIIHELCARDDEGESRYVEGIAAYPWEALGLYAPETKFTEAYSDQDVQYDKARASIDLPEENGDVQPIYRYREYGGYLGQGHHRIVAKPAKTSGTQKFSDTDVEEGLFAETVGIDGSYSLRAAKSVYIGRRVKIISPKEMKKPEDGKGDDAEVANYKFSSQFGSGDEHKLQEISITGEDKHIRRTLGVLDLIAYNVNWKALHPFHYHTKDYTTKQESEQNTNFSRVQEVLDFSMLTNHSVMDEPVAKKLDIDHRYKSVEFFERESFLYMFDEGSMMLGCGYGGEFSMVGGNMRLSPPGDLQLCPGKSVIIMADQIVLRAKRSIDVSATDHDVRIKAGGNLQMVSGVGGTGALLLESKADGREQEFKGKIGEDVKGSGIILKTTNSPISLYGAEIYLRTGGGSSNAGDIVIDAGKGDGKVVVKGQELNFFGPRGVDFFLGPNGDSGSTSSVYHFGLGYCAFPTVMLLGADLIGYGGDLLMSGSVYSGKNILAVGAMSDRNGGQIGKSPDTLASALALQVQSAQSSVTSVTSQAESKHTASLVKPYYLTGKPGADDVIDAIGFSFRDTPDEKQYGTENFKWPERRWEQMVRFGLAVGGSEWVEEGITYQGNELYPWPGKRKWKDESVFMQLDELTMFDTAKGCSKDRPGPYEDPALADVTKATMESAYKLLG